MNCGYNVLTKSYRVVREWLHVLPQPWLSKFVFQIFYTRMWRSHFHLYFCRVSYCLSIPVEPDEQDFCAGNVLEQDYIRYPPLLLDASDTGATTAQNYSPTHLITSKSITLSVLLSLLSSYSLSLMDGVQICVFSVFCFLGSWIGLDVQVGRIQDILRVRPDW